MILLRIKKSQTAFNSIKYHEIAAMMVHQNHEHVDRDGHVFVPYLSQWQPQSSLKDLLKVLVSVFSAEPPLFTK
jgi:UEV domain